jgi:ribonucleoside-diphosphate reductase alpha chain
MTTRTRLPDRRGGEVLEFKTLRRMSSEPLSYTAGLGYSPKGQLLEIFLSAGKAGTDLAIQSQETAIAVSFALQYGCPIEVMRTAMPRTAEGKPEGAIGMLLDLLAEAKP